MKRCIFLGALHVASLFQPTVQDCVQCSTEQPTTTAPHKNIWRSLSDDEVSSASSVLSQKLNLTSDPSASGKINSIFALDLLQPNKTNALPFLDSGAGQPKRYARATVLYGTFDPPYTQEYLVGPLPATNASAVQPLAFPFNNEKPGKSSISSLYVSNVTNLLAQLSSDVEDITRALFNTTISEGGINPSVGTPVRGEDGTEVAWAALLGLPSSGFDSQSLLYLGVFMRLNITSDEWKASGWYYHGVMYDSSDDFKAAISAPGFEKPGKIADGPWTSTDKQGEPFPLDELPPPITVSEGKKRFSIDVEENYASWMDFSFFLSTSTDQGLSLFDVQYKGKRIIYELALQEALAHYAGVDPFKSETIYFDSQGGMGRTMNTLMKGYDCPNHATYLNATWSAASGAQTIPDAICLFEADANHPLRRHTSIQPAYTYTSVAKNIMFTVRWISTVGNYDYLFDYQFFYDGAIEIHVRASGYISAAYSADNEEYGFLIHDFLSGSLHDHVMNFKLDMDILEGKNSVQKLEVVPATVEYPWSQGQPRNTMKLQKSFVSSEADSGINWSLNDAAQYAIVDKDSPNKYGEYPGYRIKRSAMASHLTVEHSTITGNAANYATADLFVTKQKDTEPRGADRYNQNNIEDPLVDFAKFLDDESLDQEDLVVWFNLGMHHVPHTGDLPNTLMTSAHSAIRLEPLNYLEGDPSVATNQQIKVNYTSGVTYTFGAQPANCSVDLSTLGQAGM